uniref:G-protein coupled receptors family 1 profile domain-containing protein n=1 Tax=Strongyloides venezuelensis TaxID=75913 RepID=A0A0K0FTK0_STRVS
MSSLKDLAVIVNIVSCTPLILFLPIEGFFIIYKSYHIYFKSLCLSLILAVLLHVYGNFILDIFYFLDVDTIFQSNSRFHGFLLNATRYFASYGPCICRENLWMICCERIYSTIRRKKYEQMSNKFVAFILFWLPFTYSFNIENICRTWPFLDENYTKICLFLEMCTTTLCIGLYFRCKTLKKMTFDNTLQLCEKYQAS